MAEIQSWVTVDPATKIVLGGPYAWDGVAEWLAPEVAANPTAGYELLTLADATAQGFSWPPLPAMPWVVVDSSTMTIVAGPVDWNGVGDAPLAPASDTQQLMSEMDAEQQGYQYPQS